MHSILLILIGLIGLVLLMNQKLNSNPYAGLGELQTQWVKSLQKHPERQMRSFLGRGTPKDYKACCLGELHILACKHFNQPSPFIENRIIDDYNDSSLENSYEKYGLYGSCGQPNNSNRNGLAVLNDRFMTWPEIAEIIIRNPNAFIKQPI